MDWNGGMDYYMERTVKYGMDYRICVQQTAPFHTVFQPPLSLSTLSVLRIAGMATSNVQNEFVEA